MVSQKQKHSLN